jgi:hypothetical protein
LYLLVNMKKGLLSSRSGGIVTVNVILVFILAISLVSVGSVQAASNNILFPSSLNSSKPPKPPKPLPGSQTFLTVTTKVSGGTKKPSDFTISVSGNSPSPKSFSGSSSGTSVTLFAGSYKVTESGTSGYSVSYSSGCSGTATGGRVQCTITNEYQGTPSPPTPSKNITLTSNSINVYSIPSTSVQVEKFLTNYTIIGEISSINVSKALITSTIINDFDSSPNIGYVKGNNTATTSSTTGSQSTAIPNPFVSTEEINQKITNETQKTIMNAFASTPVGKNVKIRCTFGDVLADYSCVQVP